MVLYLLLPESTLEGIDLDLEVTRLINVLILPGCVLTYLFHVPNTRRGIDVFVQLLTYSLDGFGHEDESAASKV